MKLSVGSFLFVLFAARIRDEFSPFFSAINLSFTLVPHSSSTLLASFSVAKIRKKEIYETHNWETKSKLQQLLLNYLSFLPVIDIAVATRRNEKSMNTVLDLEHNILSLCFFPRLFLFLTFFVYILSFQCFYVLSNRDRESMADVLTTRLIWYPTWRGFLLFL